MSGTLTAARRLTPDASVETCAFCGNRPQQFLWIATPHNVIAELRVCNAHTVAMQMGHWTLTVHSGDMTSGVRGAGLDEEG